MTKPGPAARSAGVAALFDRVADTYETVGPPWRPPGTATAGSASPSASA